MSREGEFLIYCLEIYKSEKSLSGKEAISLFNKYGVGEYIKRFFGALHTTGEKYIINDIDMYIESRANSRHRSLTATDD